MENNDIGRGNKILIVDDDKIVRDFLERFLKAKGYSQVYSAATGQEGLETIKNEEIKLVLLDIKLPDIDGIEVLRKIKQLKESIAVIMITGYPDEEKAKVLISKEGAYDYIVKPFDLKYLELSVLTKIGLMT